MSKYIIDTDDYILDVDGALVVGFDCDNKPATFYNSLENLEELNSDYINEHYGQLQDEAYQRGYEDGKKSVSDPDRIEVGDEVISNFGIRYVVTYCSPLGAMCGVSKNGTWCNNPYDKVTKTGKHYDIQSILEAMRT